MAIFFSTRPGVEQHGVDLCRLNNVASHAEPVYSLYSVCVWHQFILCIQCVSGTGAGAGVSQD